LSDEKLAILVVDDAPDNLTLMAGILKDHYKVKVATSGEKALAICAAQAPSLVLLDIVMPGMDGFEVCATLRAQHGTRELPVVFLSALGTPEDRVRAAALGAEFLVKPVDSTLLLATLARVLGAPGSLR